MYGKKTAAAFEKAQKDLAERPPSLAEAYKDFRPRPDAAVADPADPRWADGPVRWILTDAQKAEFAAITDPNARADYVEKFWAKLNATPERGRPQLPPGVRPARRVRGRELRSGAGAAGQHDGPRDGVHPPGSALVRGEASAAHRRRHERRIGRRPRSASQDASNDADSRERGAHDVGMLAYHELQVRRAGGESRGETSRLPRRDSGNTRREALAEGRCRSSRLRLRDYRDEEGLRENVREPRRERRSTRWGAARP
jgi:hypothetical protein